MPVVTETEWKQLYKAVPSHTIRDVEIFAAGEHNGDTYSNDDLEQIRNAFYALRGRVDPALKIGHSSDKFNKALAQELGLPIGMITGDSGEGKLAFGWIDNVRRYDNILVADFVNVPDQIASLIESQLYRHVSCELSCNFDDGGKVYPYVLSGIALLGAEQQAVSEIKGLDKAMVYAVKTTDKVKSYKYERKEETMPNGMMAKIKAKMMELMGMMEEEVPEEETPKEEEMKADDTQKLADLEAQKQANLRTASVKKLADLEAQVKTYKERAEASEAIIKKQDRDARVAKYTSIAKGWNAIAGKPEDMAERIVSLEDVDAKAAEGLVKTYTDLNTAAVAAGVTKAIGTSKEGVSGGEPEFMLKVKEFKAKGKTEAEAFREASDAFPDLYKEYRKTND